ncbi:MAG TPA: hypothetical protein VM802_08955 [Chitinophaga sp.]|uniref:hypothetical protein n=1 Tax=Chitinophaga sp. TaxID=1869181 RepID=UPI002B73E682|nr:hypothetical protein [Chitinophaga sp.]HVI44987.1 hypothetical protein [Chitinophaga sp.]
MMQKILSPAKVNAIPLFSVKSFSDFLTPDWWSDQQQTPRYLSGLPGKVVQKTNAGAAGDIGY